MSFDLSRLGRAERFQGGGAIALFISLFLFKWYGGSATAGGAGGVPGLSFSASYTGWHTFTVNRWIWLLTIVVGLGAAVIAVAEPQPRLPFPAPAPVTLLGTLSALLIVYRIAHHPTAAVSSSVGGVRYSFSYGIKLGIWLGLLSAAAVAYGGYLGMRDAER